MRARLPVVQAWQNSHERPYFYAGPGKGAEVASWRQAARAELARALPGVCYANGLLDMIKAFERVPHDWLIRQGRKYDYPMFVLRLSIVAYKLGRTPSLLMEFALTLWWLFVVLPRVEKYKNKKKKWYYRGCWACGGGIKAAVDSVAG